MRKPTLSVNDVKPSVAPINKPSRARAWAAKAAAAATSETAKTISVGAAATVAVAGVLLGLHAAQVWITKRIVIG